MHPTATIMVYPVNYITASPFIWGLLSSGSGVIVFLLLTTTFWLLFIVMSMIMRSLPLSLEVVVMSILGWTGSFRRWGWSCFFKSDNWTGFRRNSSAPSSIHLHSTHSMRMHFHIQSEILKCLYIYIYIEIILYKGKWRKRVRNLHAYSRRYILWWHHYYWYIFPRRPLRKETDLISTLYQDLSKF